MFRHRYFGYASPTASEKCGKSFGWLFVVNSVALLCHFSSFLFRFSVFFFASRIKSKHFPSDAVHQSFVIVSEATGTQFVSSHKNGAFFVFKCASFIFIVMTYECNIKISSVARKCTRKSNQAGRRTDSHLFSTYYVNVCELVSVCVCVYELLQYYSVARKRNQQWRWYTQAT